MRRSCLIAIVVVLALALVLVATVLFGAYKVSQMAKSDPKPLPGYGKPKLVKKLSARWSLYSFPDLGYRVELPEKPKPEEPEWTTAHRLVVKSWSNYTLGSEFFGFDMDGYEFRIPYELKDLAEQQEEIYLESKELKDVGSETETLQVAGKDALAQRVTYVQDGNAYVTKIYYFKHRGRWLSLNFHYWRGMEAEVAKEIDRVVESVELE